MMATNSHQAPEQQPRKMPPSNEGETPEEEQLQQALNHLDHLYAKCQDMRSALARMITSMPEAIPSNGASPEACFNEVVKVMRNTGTEIQEFTALYTNEETKKVLEQAKKSRKANPKGIKPWYETYDPAWPDTTS
ncbi:hypothetical protein GGS20DRAFT_570310 [Poronia punctata]|nr:hypothetical protein GGS20DRAFT_570310 [Poronia punctata]